MKALILAAGYATRLYPLTKEYPKPLLEVGGRPIINYIINKLRPLSQINEIIVVTNSKFIRVFQQWAKEIKIDKRISLVDDLTKSHSDRRGAVGDMHFVIEKKRLKDDLLVIGGDNLFDGNLRDFLSFAVRHKPYPIIGAYKMKERKEAKNYGVIKVNKQNKIIDFQEKPRKPRAKLVAMCLYYFPKEKLGLLREYLNSKKNKHDATGFYIDWLRKKVAVYGFVFEGRWYDIGHHRFYDEAKEKFKGGD